MAQETDEIEADIENGLPATQFEVDAEQVERGLEWVRKAINEEKETQVISEELECVHRKLREMGGDITKFGMEHSNQLEVLKTRVLQYSNIGSQFIVLVSRLRESAHDNESIRQLEQMHKDMAVYIDAQQNIVINIEELNAKQQETGDGSAVTRSIDPETLEAQRKKMKRLKFIIIGVIMTVAIVVIIVIVLSQVLN